MVNVSSELHPGSFERNNPGRVKLLAIGMKTCTEKYTGRTMQLRNNNPFGSIHNERAFRSHIWDHSQIDVLDNSFEIFVLGIGTEEF